MSHVSDFTQNGDKVVLDLINEQNGTALGLNDVTVTLKSVQDPTTKNTVALVTAKEGSGYTGTQRVEYDRLDIADLVDLYYPEGIVLQQGDAENISDLVPEIEVGLAIRLTEGLDYQDQPIGDWSGVPNESKSFTLQMINTSMIYVGNLQVMLDGNDIPLNTVITQLLLNGLNLPTTGGGNNGGNNGGGNGGGEEQQPPSMTGPLFEALMSFDVVADPTQRTYMMTSDSEVNEIKLDGVSIEGTPQSNGRKQWIIEPGTSGVMTVYLNPNGTTFSISSSDNNAATFVMTSWGADLKEHYVINLRRLIDVPAQLPTTVTTLENMFSNCRVFVGNGVATWYTRNITNASGAFYDCRVFNADISGFDTRNLENMYYMFAGDTAFNQDLSGWNTSKVTLHEDYDTGTTAWEASKKPSFAA